MCSWVVSPLGTSISKKTKGRSGLLSLDLFCASFRISAWSATTPRRQGWERTASTAAGDPLHHSSSSAIGSEHYVPPADGPIRSSLLMHCPTPQKKKKTFGNSATKNWIELFPLLIIDFMKRVKKMLNLHQDKRSSTCFIHRHPSPKWVEALDLFPVHSRNMAQNYTGNPSFPGRWDV